MRFSAVLLAVVSAASVSLAQTASGTGDATFYSAGLGACGVTNTDADFIAAIDAQTFDTFPGAGANPNLNPICHKQVTVTGPDGKTVNVLVTDRCPGCAKGSIDLTPTAFQQLASLDVGRLHGITWTMQ
ncbi:RlpA-like double-psi beta-barrel-protein domain-containing protein-containing protein [Trametes polyzona]|nr:RlpA-like double-psi beta-barrel-protein domain-containing protein-containing protein [Trametes polyzona]KAI0632609.1 RlpA-like double-psi beta-barrel-protein domain-containing protein-containing protein [Trametes polyzona]